MLDLDVTAEEVLVGNRRLQICRPARPDAVDDPDAERTVGPVWAHVWLSGVVLANMVSRRRLRRIRVLELGCGLGLVALAAAGAGGHVTVSDRSRYALAFTAVNAKANGLSVETVRCEWRDPRPLLELEPWDLVLGSDILYDQFSALHLLALLDRVVAPAGEVWLADPGRDAASAFLTAAGTNWSTGARSRGYGVRVLRLLPRHTRHGGR